MLRNRVIPCLLLKNKGLVKSVKFKDYTYIGDPINAVKIYNDKEVDEIIFLDITATKESLPPSLDLIADIASECFMPFCYGGGIKNVEIIRQLLKLGVEKVAFNSAAFKDPNIITGAARLFGTQAIVISVDVKKDTWGRYKLFINGGTVNTGVDPITFVKHVQQIGAGEILVNNIDRDGTMMGYDIELLKNIVSNVSIPVIACGGAGKLADFKQAVDKAKVSAVAAGSLFVYHGKTRGILINYPSFNELEKLFA